MTDLRKFKDILLDLIVMQHVYFINNNSNKYRIIGSLKGRYNISLRIVIVVGSVNIQSSMKY